MNINIINWDDGHTPGSTPVQTRMAIYENKTYSSFVETCDNFVDSTWENRIYEFSVARSAPWGRIRAL